MLAYLITEESENDGLAQAFVESGLKIDLICRMGCIPFHCLNDDEMTIIIRTIEKTIDGDVSQTRVFNTIFF